MFGIRHQLRYGLVDRIEHDRLEMTFTADFGGLPAGTTLPFAVAGNEHSRSYLPVRPTDAEVVAVDQDGRPALLRRKVGSGWIVLCTYPLEHMATLVAGVNPDATVRLYDALAVTAGLRRSVLVDNPLVSADVLRHGDGRRFAFVVSHSDHAAKVEPQVPAGRLVEPDSGTAVESMELEPHGVRMLLLDD